MTAAHLRNSIRMQTKRTLAALLARKHRLAELNEHIEKVIQMYLRNEYETITQPPPPRRKR